MKKLDMIDEKWINPFLDKNIIWPNDLSFGKIVIEVHDTHSYQFS